MRVSRPTAPVEWAIRGGACGCLRLRLCLRRRLRLESAALRPAAAARSGTPSSADDPQRFTPLNKPVVRQSQAVGYGQFLQDVRSLSIKEVVVSHEGTDRALLLYKDGRVRYCQFPADDPRLADVLSTYGVVATAAVPEPSPPDSAQLRQLKDAAMYWVPAALIGVVYAVVTHMARTKGDYEDRVKLRKLADAERQEAKERAIKEAMEDAAGGEAMQPVSGGLSIEDASRFLSVTAKRVRGRDVAADKETAAAGGAASKRKPRSVTLTGGVRMTRDERITFADVAGIGEGKQELMEVVDFFLKPEKYKRSGSKVPKGVLLVGPPGTGKTLLARAVAGEAGVDFFSITASAFVEMFVGVGAARVRSLFEQAKAAAPAIVFIDELDAVGRKRGGGGSGNDERDQTLNQLLSELDGFDPAKRSLVVIAATNRPDVLDAALVRPGRFDRKVYVAPPDAGGRLDILLVHTRGKPLAPDVDLSRLAADTRGFTGAALASLVNVAALGAAREGASSIAARHLEAALESETLGKALPVDGQQGQAQEETARRLALWRSAQALACEVLPGLPSVELVSIAPRESTATGFVRLYPDQAFQDTGLVTAAALRDQLVATLVPRAAEEAVYGWDGVSTLHAPALDHARSLASRSVVQYGFFQDEGARPQLGRKGLGVTTSSADFLGGGSHLRVAPHVGQATYAAADAETVARLQDAYVAAQALVAAHRTALQALTQALQADGTLSGDDVRTVLGLPNKYRAPEVVDASATAVSR